MRSIIYVTPSFNDREAFPEHKTFIPPYGTSNIQERNSFSKIKEVRITYQTNWLIGNRKKKYELNLESTNRASLWNPIFFLNKTSFYGMDVGHIFSSAGQKLRSSHEHE